MVCPVSRKPVHCTASHQCMLQCTNTWSCSRNFQGSVPAYFWLRKVPEVTGQSTHWEGWRRESGNGNIVPLIAITFPPSCLLHSLSKQRPESFIVMELLLLHITQVLPRSPVSMAKGTLNNIKTHLYQSDSVLKKRLCTHIDQYQTQSKKPHSIMDHIKSRKVQLSQPEAAPSRRLPSKVQHCGWGKFSHTDFPIRKWSC